MCYFSFLTDPFHYTLIFSALHALITKLGYSRCAELIYFSILAVFGRAESQKFMANWKALKAAKTEVSKVSPQVNGVL